MTNNNEMQDPDAIYIVNRNDAYTGTWSCAENATSRKYIRADKSPIVGGDVKEALDARAWTDTFVNQHDGSDDYPFIGELYDLQLIEFAFKWLFNSEDFRALTHAPALDAVKVPEGYKLVPIEPTEAMADAANGSVNSLMARHVYQKMLSAAPSDKRGG